jgi:prepilin-type N-terminal cleavage/methylation domain-containing protein
MSPSSPNLPARSRRGFTMVEVMVAAVVLVFGLVSALNVMQRGLQAMDTARNLASAASLMQGEMERLRLYSWTQLADLQASGSTQVAPAAGTALPGFSCTRRITDVRTGMKQITLDAVWTGYDGRPHQARLITRYGQNGLSDYISTSH